MGYEENQVDDDNANVVRQRLWRQMVNELDEQYCV